MNAFVDLRRRVTQGELGSLPVVIGLVVIWIVFQVKNDRFLTSGNLTNLVLQIAAVGTISVGVVSGLAAGVTAVLNVKHDVPAVPALLCGLGVGLAIGVFQGLFASRLL